MPCPCCVPQPCDCQTLSEGSPFPLPPGKTGISLQLTLKIKAGYAAHYHEDGTITDVDDDVSVEIPMTGPTAQNDYEGGVYFNFLTGEVDPTNNGWGAFRSNVVVRLRCWRGGGAPKQGQFYIGFGVNLGGAFGYREDGEWVWTPGQPSISGFAGEAWFDPVIVDGNCQAWEQTVLQWPEDFSNPGTELPCEDLGLCAELNFVYS